MLTCYKVAEETGRKVVYDARLVGGNSHESVNLTMKYILELFPDVLELQTIEWTPCAEIKNKEYSYQPEIYNNIPKETPIKLIGFFQNLEWIPKRLPIVAQTLYPNTVFLHIRLGDYIGSGFDVNLQEKYYSNAIQLIQTRSTQQVHFLVFSDTPSNAEEILKSLPCKFSYTMSTTKESLGVLREMAACYGGICSNSSLSFLGAFFQQTHRGIVTVPKIWRKPDILGPPIPWANIVDN